jgi:hypothetical protein
VALGSTVQTTLVTALSVVPLPKVAGGSSLINATRQVVQATAWRCWRQCWRARCRRKSRAATTDSRRAAAGGAAPFGVCDAPIAIRGTASVQLPSNASQLLEQACVETVGGFEQAYKVTFFASIAAVVLGLMLPGWPGKWAGRRAADAPTVAAH